MTDKVVPDPRKCGAGRKAECCIFLVCGANGFECGRESASLKHHLVANRLNMTAQRTPDEAYPQCMKEW